MPHSSMEMKIGHLQNLLSFLSLTACRVCTIKITGTTNNNNTTITFSKATHTTSQSDHPVAPLFYNHQSEIYNNRYIHAWSHSSINHRRILTKTLKIQTLKEKVL